MTIIYPLNAHVQQVLFSPAPHLHPLILFDFTNAQRDFFQDHGGFETGLIKYKKTIMIVLSPLNERISSNYISSKCLEV